MAKTHRWRMAMLAVVALLAMPFAYATNTTQPSKQDQHQDQQQAQAQEQAQEQAQGQDQQQTQTATGTGTASADNAGVSTNTEVNTENNSTNVVLVPNNNTESCVRVFGLAFGKNGESGALGVPWRSKSCDFEQAADDAFAAGERELGWYWKCHNKNLYKQFKVEGERYGLRWKPEQVQAAVQACHGKMIGNRMQDTINSLTKQVSMYQTMYDERKLETYRLSEQLEKQRNDCKQEKDRMSDRCFGTK